MRKKWWIILLLAGFVLFGTVCEVQGQSCTQWAVTASASSEYGSGDWSAKQMLGEPDFYPNYGDDRRAWAPSSQDAGGLNWGLRRPFM